MEEFAFNLENYKENGFINNIDQSKFISISNTPSSISPTSTDSINLLNFGFKVDVLENLNLMGKFISKIDSNTLGNFIFLF